MLTTAAQPASHDDRPSTPLETAAEIRRLQSRLAELQTSRHGIALEPVTFHAFGAGAQTVVGNPGMVLFTFPVHHAKVVRVAVEYATACQAAQSLVETLGGWGAVRARGHRHTKRGCRRGLGGKAEGRMLKAEL